MTDLLIHSMSEFSDIILGGFHAAGVAHVAEIGAEYGGMSQKLADFTASAGGSLTSIDPAPKPAFLDWAKANGHVHHVAEPSLDAIPTLGNVDAWVVDGDHNYYTVFHELQAIDALCARDDKPLFAVLHDVSWPNARRDSYYAPDRIPEDWRHPYSFDAGVTLDSHDMVIGRGFRGHGQFAYATVWGGPRNGVLTAVEDFIAQSTTDERQLAFAHIPAVFGLGILFDMAAPWAADVAAIVHPYHDNELLASLEANRLRNYLAVIEWQDREAERLARAAA